MPCCRQREKINPRVKHVKREVSMTCRNNIHEKRSFYWHIPIKKCSVLTSNSFFPAVVKDFECCLERKSMLYDSPIKVSVKNLVMESHHTKSPQHRVKKELWGRVSIERHFKNGWREKARFIFIYLFIYFLIAHSYYTILFVVNGVDSFVFICRLLFPL